MACSFSRYFWGPSFMDKMIIGIDVGGTKVAGGLVDRKGRLYKAITLPTKASDGFEVSFGQVAAVIRRLVKQAGGPDHIKGIGLCCPGPLNPRTGMVINPPQPPWLGQHPFCWASGKAIPDSYATGKRRQCRRVGGSIVRGCSWIYGRFLRHRFNRCGHWNHHQQKDLSRQEWLCRRGRSRHY